MSEAVGALQSIWRFPIKSFQGESIERTRIGAGGIHADRVFALRSRESGKIVSGKHARLGDRVLEFDARYVAEPTPGEAIPPIEATIDGRALRADDVESFASVCSEALGHPVELVAAGASDLVYDSYWPDVADLPLAGAEIDLPLPLAEAGSFADLEPLHVLTTSSLAMLASLAPESRVEVGRFRPSLVIDTGGAAGFVENDWSGRVATLGDATLEFGGPAPRCIMTTRAQRELPRDPAILKTLVRENRREFMGMMMPCLGLYAKVTGAGDVAVGDSLRFES